MTEAQPLSLLDCFADFYAELAREKLACDEHNAAADADPAALASAVSNRLYAFLDHQLRMVRLRGTPAEIEAYGDLRMVMAAAADEAFLLDLPWCGRMAWLGVMLEPRVCDSRSAGSHFFACADRLIRADQRGAVACDSAAALLLALQLGFQGRYRGAEGQRPLHNYRRKLFKLATGGVLPPPQTALFAAAYSSCIVLPAPPMHGWVRPLLRAIGGALAGYLMLSLPLWFWLVQPFLQRIGNLPGPG